MNEPPPEPLRKPLPYRRPDRVREPPDPENTWGRFVGGLGVGTAASALLWVGGAVAPNVVPIRVVVGLAAVVVPLTKFVVGASMLSQPAWKKFGLGLFASIGVGALILFGVCWVGMTTH